MKVIIISQRVTFNHDECGNENYRNPQTGKELGPDPREMESDERPIRLEIRNGELIIKAYGFHVSSNGNRGGEGKEYEYTGKVTLSSSEVNEIFRECIKNGLLDLSCIGQLQQIKDAEEHLACAANCLAGLTQDKPSP